ncbi:MAG TPA: hypothetical protein VFQ85_19490 [Mycobacteriales bacterium]|nr:hypothetical protein [Mycobacteriales bacterium]
MRRSALAIAALAAVPLLAQPASATWDPPDLPSLGEYTSCHLVATTHHIITADFDISYTTYSVEC